MSNGTQAFFKYMLLQAPRFRSTPLYSCVGLPFSSHLIYGLGLLSRLFNTKYIIRIARFLFVFVSEAAKNLVVATTAAPSVRALRAPITNTSYGSEVTFYVPFGRCHRPRTVARGVGDTDEVEQSVLSCSFLGVWSRGFGRGSQAICGIFTGVLLVCGSGGMDKKAKSWKCSYICSGLFDGELSLYASIRCSGLY